MQGAIDAGKDLLAVVVVLLAAASSVKGEAAPLSDFFLGTASPYGGLQACSILPANHRRTLSLVKDLQI